MAAPYDARSIANLILDLGHESRLPVTQLTVLKIIYFSHGWYLARTGLPLVKQDFEAWKYGPVVKVVRDSFKHFADNPITTKARKYNIYSDTYEDLDEEIDWSDREHVAQIFRTYSVHNGWTLSEMTHEAGSPWDQIWNSVTPLGRVGMRILNGEIKQHFLARLGGDRVI
ncbi:MAG: hypothetical protein JWN11_1419 [Hyphomicrobiales bacterium]|nr:hypothetical protein [Hyphomicrobiales bacterium]